MVHQPSAAPLGPPVHRRSRSPAAEAIKPTSRRSPSVSPPPPELCATFAVQEAHSELGASTTGPRAPPTTTTTLLFAASMLNRCPLPSIVAADVHRALKATPPSSAHGRRSPWVAGTRARASLPLPLHPAEPLPPSGCRHPDDRLLRPPLIAGLCLGPPSTPWTQPTMSR
ncbi:hypothetical protein E2562_026839 [Oryza meyeriana var. granulata]|uniref:Uncharacterized protein n=1 Tax=Oryza meyeriana var. granulata TaxID=110450 RepID=A0A6G1CIV3_9ORYZ|nr:hypothetical protein E2562_026839 [Oryza meyeriana var. granulata]